MSDRLKWLEERRKSIGASESSALLGIHPFISAFSLWESKVNPKIEDDPDEDDRRADGLFFEPRIAAKYTKKTGRQVLDSPGLVEHPKHKYMTATPDRIAVFGHDTQPGPLELKWLEAYRVDDEVPVYIQSQLQQQIACLGADVGSVAILGSFRSFSFVDCERNQAFIDLLAEKIASFWERHVIPGIPPTADGSKSTKEALRRLWPAESGETKILPSEAVNWAERLAWAKDQAKEMEEQKAEAENKLRAAIGDATYGKLPDGRMVSLKTQSRGAYTVQPTTFRVLRIEKGSRNGNSSRD